MMLILDDDVTLVYCDVVIMTEEYTGVWSCLGSDDPVWAQAGSADLTW